jgi:membrane protease YdiL (CAAX protease family)
MIEHHQVEPPPLPFSAARSPWRKLWLPVTVGCAAITVVCVGLLASLTWSTRPVEYLSYPVAAATRVGEIDLDFAEVARTQSAAERWAYRALGYSTERVQPDVADGYARILDFLEEDEAPWTPASEVAGLRGRRAIVLAELGRWEQAEAELDALPPGWESEEFRAALTAAYGLTGDDPPVSADLSLLALDEDDDALGTWSSQIVRARMAEQAGDAASAREWMEAIWERGRRLVPWARALAGLEIAVLLAGWTLIAVRWRVAIREYWTAGGMTVSRWSFRYGSGVLVRCVTLVAAVQSVVWFMPAWVLSLSTFWSSVPALLLAHIYLFRPAHTDFAQAFGLRPPDISWTKVGWYALGLTAVDQLGCLAIYGVLDAFELANLWEEAIDETILFGPWWEAGLLALDGIVWAPFFEEIGFRGILYATLRSRLRPLPAAAISALIFGFAHVYSLAGFLEVTWTGFILAVGYERCRSLWPCIVAHAFNNGLYFVAMWVFYR